MTMPSSRSLTRNNFVQHTLYEVIRLDGVYGGIEIKSPNRNLIIIDISGSIPKGVSSTCLILSKNLAESFYADILITGSKSTIYSYEDLGSLNIEAIYNENGMENDQAYFKKLVQGEAINDLLGDYPIDSFIGIV